MAVRDRGQQLRPPAAAELAGGQPAGHHRGPRRERGPHPQPEQRHAEQLQRHPRQQRRQHRLVNIAGLQMPGTVQEVQLVAVKAIPCRQRHQHGENDAANPDHPPVERAGDRHHGSGGQGLPRLLAGFGGWDGPAWKVSLSPGSARSQQAPDAPGVAGWIITGGCVHDWCSFGAESGGKPGGDALRSGPPWRPLLSLPGSAGRCLPGGQTLRPTGIHRRPRDAAGGASSG